MHLFDKYEFFDHLYETLGRKKKVTPPHRDIVRYFLDTCNKVRLKESLWVINYN